MAPPLSKRKRLTLLPSPPAVEQHQIMVMTSLRAKMMKKSKRWLSSDWRKGGNLPPIYNAVCKGTIKPIHKNHLQCKKNDKTTWIKAVFTLSCINEAAQFVTTVIGDEPPTQMPVLRGLVNETATKATIKPLPPWCNVLLHFCQTF